MGVLFLCAVVSSGCFEGTTCAVLASVLSCDGTATVTRGSSSESVAIDPQITLGPGDVIETARPGAVRLCLLPNLLAQLEHDTQLKLGELAITKDGNETGNAIRARTAAARLLKGRIFVSHVWGEAIPRFSLETPHGRLAVSSNALFCVEVDPGRTRVTCASGLVAFEPADASPEIRISAGFVAENSGGAFAVRPAETDPSAQENLSYALQIEQDLRKLASSRRNVLPR